MSHLPGGCTGSFGASLSRRNHSNDHDLVIYHGSSLMFRYTGLAPRWRMLQPQASRTRAARSSDMPRQSERAGLVYVGVAARVKPPECCARACLDDGVIVIHTHARDENEIPYYMSTSPKKLRCFGPCSRVAPNNAFLDWESIIVHIGPPGQDVVARGTRSLPLAAAAPPPLTPRAYLALRSTRGLAHTIRRAGRRAVSAASRHRGWRVLASNRPVSSAVISP